MRPLESGAAFFFAARFSRVAVSATSPRTIRCAFAALLEKNMVAIRLPDGSVRQYDHPVTVAEVAASIGPGLAKAALGGKLDGELVDTSALIDRAGDRQWLLLRLRIPASLHAGRSREDRKAHAGTGEKR